MPLDPIIANPAKFDSGDRLADFSNYLLAANRQEAMNAARREQAEMNALNGAYKDSGGDRVKLKNYLLERNLGRMLPAVEKAWAELDKTAEETNYKKAETGWKHEQTRTEVADQGLKNAQATEHTQKAYETAVNTYKEQLDAISPDVNVGADQYAQWILHKYQDPLMGKILRDAKHTPDEELANLKRIVAQGPQAFQDFLMRTRMGMAEATKKHTTVVDNGGTNVMVETNDHSFGASKPDTLQTWKVTESPKAPRTTVQVHTQVIAGKGEEAYTKRRNEHQADDDHDLEKAAAAAPDLIRRADRIMEVLRSGKVITGTGAPLRLGVEKLKNMVPGMGDPELIANTETLGSDLAKMTLDHIRTSGLGGGNGFTDKDREFLEKAVSGNMTWDNASLQRMAGLARQQAEETIRRNTPRHQEVGQTGIVGRAMPKNPPTVPPKPVQHRSNPQGFQQNVQELKAGRMTRKVFDHLYGEGASAKVLGGK